MKYTQKLKSFRRVATAGIVALAAAYGFLSGSAYAQQAAPSPSPATVKASDGKETKEVKKVVEQPKPPEPRSKLYGGVEGGITGNPDAPVDSHNFGHLFTDRANEPLLNQVVITAERALAQTPPGSHRA